jgi:peptidoglycan/LPS O-acetylase OafA/YrhL
VTGTTWDCYDSGVTRCDFYASRLLRLVPLYWVIGLLTVAAELWLVPHGQQFHKLVSPVANVSELDLGSLPVPLLAYVVCSSWDSFNGHH